ncbi:MAG: class I tRNA ligase family protein, partial [Patescibacteria group bacterium]
RETEQLRARASAKVAEDGDRFKFNTAVAALMILVNELETLGSVPKVALMQLVTMLAPFAPHLAEHLWEKLGGEGSVHQQSWPIGSITAASEVEVVVQVAGRRRGSVRISPSAEEAEAVAKALKIPVVFAALAGKKPKRVVYVPSKIINLVV